MDTIQDPKSKGWIATHWRGERPLPAAFWLNYVIVAHAAALGLIFVLFQLCVALRVADLPLLEIYGVAAVALIWGWVGVWRSAGDDEVSTAAAILARCAVVLEVLGVVFILYIGVARRYW